MAKKSAKPATKKAASTNERGYGSFAVPKISAKNLKSTEVKDLNLRDFVLGALAANPELTNEELFKLVNKAGRDNSQSTTEWYAARVRQGHIKVKKGK